MSTPTLRIETIQISAPQSVDISKVDTDTDTEFGPSPDRVNKLIRKAVAKFQNSHVTDSDYIEVQVGGSRVVIFLNTQKGK